MNITLRQLYGFKTVADVGTFTAAAQRLKVAQPALSLNIRDLESELGTRLFDRTTRRVELTAAGREFLLSVDKLILDLEHAVQNARELAERKRGRLAVAAPPLLATMIVDKVRNGEADCGIGTFAEVEDGIRREALFEDALMAWCPVQSQLTRL